MCRCGGTRLYTYLQALAGLCALNALPSALSAQPLETPNASFEERFSLDDQALPTFTRPEVQRLLLSLQPAAIAEDSTGSTEATPDEPHSRSQIAFSKPKGPARVLQELLSKPAKELLVSRAEAEPRQPPSSSVQEAEPQASRPPETPAEQMTGQQIGLVQGRNAEPLLERPPPEAAVPAPAQSDQLASR
jgi:hypothetical protein